MAFLLYNHKHMWFANRKQQYKWCATKENCWQNTILNRRSDFILSKSLKGEIHLCSTSLMVSFPLLTYKKISLDWSLHAQPSATSLACKCLHYYEVTKSWTETHIWVRMSFVNCITENTKWLNICWTVYITK